MNTREIRESVLKKPEKYILGLPERLLGFIKSPLFISAVVAAVTLTVFVSVLSADFVMWDDDVIIYDNPKIRCLNLGCFAALFKDVDSMMRYNPLTLLGWAITYHFAGLNPFWYHFGNWLLHGLNAALVFLVIRKLLLLGFARRGLENPNPVWLTIACGLAALLWSLHPLRVEPVAWATDRTYCQSLFFLLLSVLCYLKANETEVSAARGAVLLSISVICYVASLLSYAIGLFFFFVFFILDIYPLGRIRITDGWLRTSEARRALLEKIPFLLASVIIASVSVCVRIASAGIWRKPIGLAQFGLAERFMQAFYVWAYYMWRPFYPVKLAPVYTQLVSFEPFSLPFVASALAVIAVVTLCVFLRHRLPILPALAASYLILLIPVLGLLEHPHYPCDRYSIIVSIIFSVIIAALLVNPKTKRILRYCIFLLSIVAIVTFGSLSRQQTRIWNNSVALFEHMLKTLGDDPYCRDIYWRLGKAFQSEGNLQKAISNYLLTLNLQDDHEQAHNELGKALQKQNKIDEAIRHFQQAIINDPNFADAHNNLGVVLVMRGDLNGATECFRRSLQEQPDYAEAHNNLANILASQGKIAEAIEHLQFALKVNPYSYKAHYNLGIVLQKQGKYESALEHIKKALQIKPDFEKARKIIDSISNIWPENTK